MEGTDQKQEPKVVTQSELEALGKPATWQEFKEKIQEYRKDVLELDITSDKIEVATLRRDIGELAERLRNQGQGHLVNVLIMIDRSVDNLDNTGIIQLYSGIKAIKEQIGKYIDELLSVEEFITKADVVQEVTEKPVDPVEQEAKE